MQLPYVLSIIASTVELTICLVCAHQLLRLRELSGDPSRRLLALGSFLSGALALSVVAANIAMANAKLTTLVLQPWVGLVYMIMNIVMTLYPIKVVRPDWLTPRRYFFLFLPTLVLAVVYLCFTNHWTLLHGPQDIWAHALEPDVLARLAGLFIMIPYCLILFMLPYNYQHSSASIAWIWRYSLGLMSICLVHVALMLTHYPPLFILMPLAAAAFFYLSTMYELEERLLPITRENPAEDAGVPAAEALEPELWPRIVRLMDRQQVWRDPDLSLSTMARLCATNATSLNRTIKQETGSSFKELLNTKRIEHVAAQLRNNPATDIQEAFFNAGFRSRTTAWRNFRDIMGVSPTDYRQGENLQIQK